MYGRLQQNHFNSHHNHHQQNFNNTNNFQSNSFSNGIGFSSNYLQQSQYEPRNTSLNGNGSFYHQSSLLGPVPNDSSIHHNLIASSRSMQQTQLGNNSVLTLSPSIQTSISNFHANSLLNNNNNSNNNSSNGNSAGGVNANRMNQNGLANLSNRLNFNANNVNSSTSLLGNPSLQQANNLNNRNNINHNGNGKVFSGKNKNSQANGNKTQTPRFNSNNNNTNNNANNKNVNKTGVEANKSVKKEPETIAKTKVTEKNDENVGEKTTKVDTTSDAYIQKLKTCIDANRRNINQRLNSTSKSQVNDAKSNTNTTSTITETTSATKAVSNGLKSNGTQNGHEQLQNNATESKKEINCVEEDLKSMN
jgi:hypothetical protein